MRTTPARSILLLAVAATGLLSSCGDDTSTSGAGGGKGATFVLNEWAITPPAGTLHAGTVKVVAKNIGGELHELVIVRADSAGSLPRKADGSVDEDAIAEADKPGEVPDVPSR
jgi:hypothetical protein